MTQAMPWALRIREREVEIRAAAKRAGVKPHAWLKAEIWKSLDREAKKLAKTPKPTKGVKR